MNIRKMTVKVLICMTITSGVSGCNILNRADEGYLHRYGVEEMDPLADQHTKRLPLENVPSAAVKRPIKVYQLKEPKVKPMLDLNNPSPNGNDFDDNESNATVSVKNSYRSEIIRLESEKEKLAATEESLKKKVSSLEKQLSERLNSVQNLQYYEVAKGDSLWSIAGKKDVYGDHYKWLEIYNANKDKIENPDKLYPGQRLLIPQVMPNQKKEKSE